MPKFEVGDRVRIKPRKDWLTPPGYVLANAEGTVEKWVEHDEAMADFAGYTYIKKIKLKEPQKFTLATRFF